MKNILLFAVFLLLLAGCKKHDRGNDKNSCPPELVGKWVRGEFAMANFAGYEGTTIIDASLTTGALEFSSNGEVNAYSVSFPTNAQSGCNPQVLLLYNGTANYPVSGKLLMQFTGGSERKFYQQCPGKINTERTLTAIDFNGALTCYWSVETIGSETLLGIRYDLPDNPKIYFKKTNW